MCPLTFWGKKLVESSHVTCGVRSKSGQSRSECESVMRDPVQYCVEVPFMASALKKGHVIGSTECNKYKKWSKCKSVILQYGNQGVSFFLEKRMLNR